MERARHTVAAHLPMIIQPQPRRLEIAVTSACNLRCVGCRYGRDFMPNQELPWRIIRPLLDDARQAGIWSVRFYGGEPLLHPDLAAMVEHSVSLGMRSYVTTNAVLLEKKIDELYRAGLRDLTIGFYGVGVEYDRYVQRAHQFARVEAGIAAVRNRYGAEVNLRINWLLSRHTCTVEDLRATWEFAERYHLGVQIDLIHYSLPYFTEGPDRCLQFTPDDADAIDRVVLELVALKQRHPERITQSLEALRSIPDWLRKGPDMKIPCDSYQMLWVGADGTVQLCYVTFKLGNLHAAPLSTMLLARRHAEAARDCFSLNCPNCHCHYDTRIQKHTPSMRRYA
jgi:cyclic pyranopterin phosphate synthase